MTDPWTSVGTVETFTGGQFDVFDPAPESVRLGDIAAGLAHTCRFGGHCSRFYSVAEHSLHVSQELSSDRPRLQLVGLLHDAAEAYIGDIPRPLKAELDGIETVEHEILDAVWRAFDVSPPTDDEWATVMEADDRLLAYEATHLLEDGSWAAESSPLGYELGGDAPETVRERFRTRTERLVDQI